MWTELKDNWSAETAPVSAAGTTRRRIDFAPLPLADTDMQMLLLCDTTHQLRTDANKQPLKTNHNPEEWHVIFFFFFFPLREQKVRNIPLWLMHHLLPELRLSSLQCRITTPAMSSPPNPPILLLATFSRVVGLIWRCQESSPLGKHIKDSERESVFS